MLQAPRPSAPSGISGSGPSFRKRRCLPAIVFSVCIAGFSPNLLADDSVPSEAAAEVNGTIISKSELEHAVERQIGSQVYYFQGDSRRFIEQEVLKTLIDQKLLKSAAEEWQQKRTPGEDRTEKTTSGGRDLVTEYLREAVLGGVTVSPEEVSAEVAKRAREAAKISQVHLRQIFFAIPPGTGEEEVRQLEQRAQAAATRAAADPDSFVELVKEYSDGSAREKGGDLGFMTLNQLPSNISAAVQELSAGKCTGVLRTSEGFHILRLDERVSGEDLPEAELRRRVAAELLTARRDAALNRQLELLRKEAHISQYVP